MPWSDWILFDLPEGEAHFVGADPEILRAFLTLMLRSDDLEFWASSIGPQEWLPHRLEQVESMLDETLRDEVLQSSVLFDGDHIRSRTELLKESLRRSARQQTGLEEEKIRQSSLAAEKIEAFESQVREAWSQNRLAAPLFRLASSYEEAEDPPLSEDDPRFFGAHQWLPKSLFVREPQVFGGDSIARQVGFGMADGEVRELLRVLSDSLTEEAGASSSLAETVRAIIRSMEGDGYEPFVVFVPSARIYRGDAELYDTQEPGVSPVAEVLNSVAGRRFRGYIEGVPVFDSNHVPEDRICIADLASFATWRQLAVDEEGGWLLMTIEDFDEERALIRARENSEIPRGEEGAFAEDRAAQIRSRVYLKVRERYELEVKDSGACRWLRVDG